MSCRLTPAISRQARQLPHPRVDVARHGDVDEQQRSSLSRGHHVLELVSLDDVVGRVGRRDDDVGLLQLFGQLLEAHGAALETLGEADGAVVVAVGDEDR